MSEFELLVDTSHKICQILAKSFICSIQITRASASIIQMAVNLSILSISRDKEKHPAKVFSFDVVRRVSAPAAASTHGGFNLH